MKSRPIYLRYIRFDKRKEYLVAEQVAYKNFLLELKRIFKENIKKNQDPVVGNESLHFWMRHHVRTLIRPFLRREWPDKPFRHYFDFMIKRAAGAGYIENIAIGAWKITDKIILDDFI